MSLLWVAVSEIAAHIYAVRIGAATGKKMDKVRRARWILSLGPTFLLWRRMKLWELRSYDEVLQLEQQRIVYQALLRGRFGRAWRRKAPVESLLPLRLVNAGVPLAESAPDGLRSAGIKPSGIFASPAEEVPTLPAPARASTPTPALAAAPATAAPAIPTAPPVTTALSNPPPVTATVPPRSQPQPKRQWSIPPWSTEDELYEIVKDVLDNGRREVFLPGGPLTGAEIARVLQQSEGNGRKVRQRLIKTYAAKRNVDLQPKATINQVFAAFAQPLTAVSP
ncbi:hypothetical protein [Streptomyces phaeoluteigriseus]